MINLEELATELLTYRVKNNLTQKQCAKEFGVSNSTICSIENKSKSIRQQTIIKVAMILKERNK